MLPAELPCRIIHGERGDRPPKVVFGRFRNSVLTVSHVNKAGIASQNSSLARRLEPKRICISSSTHNDSLISSSFRTAC